MMTSTICSSNKLGNWLTVRNSDVLQQIFPVHVISWNGDAEWLARSLLFVWRYLKWKVLP